MVGLKGGMTGLVCGVVVGSAENGGGGGIDWGSRFGLRVRRWEGIVSFCICKIVRLLRVACEGGVVSKATGGFRAFSGNARLDASGRWHMVRRKARK
jgi:hypothetical protein